MHPSFKTQYFVKAKWESGWISAARELLKDEWEANYKSSADAAATAREHALHSSRSEVCCHVLDFLYVSADF